MSAGSEAGDGSGEGRALGARQTGRRVVSTRPAVPGAARLFGLLERHLQDPAAQLVAVQGGNGDQCVLVVGHRDEAVALALGRRKVTHHLPTTTQFAQTIMETVAKLKNVQTYRRADILHLSPIRPGG